MSTDMPKEENAENEEFLEKLNNKNSYIDENNTFRSTKAQFTAGWIASLTSVSIGTMLSFPTIIIGEFRKPNEDIYLNEDQASWIGSLLYLLQPFSSVLGGLIQTYVGRKNGMILTFIPELIGLVLVSSAKSVLSLYVAMTLFGISVGSMESPTIAYLGEIAQPRIRGKILSSGNVFISGGFLLLYFLGSIFNCRTVAAICISLPVISIVATYFIPDSPMWLLKKGRNEDALKALCWLRGWVSPDRVHLEYKNLCDYVEKSNLSNFSKPKAKQSICSKLKTNISNFLNPNIRKPFILISICYFACHGATLNGMRAYFIEILNTMHTDLIEPELFTFLSSVLMMCGGIICFAVIKCLGKRVALLLSLMICSLICMILSFYIFYMEQLNLAWIPMAGLLLLHLIMTIGIYPIPWMLLSEIFPLKLRSMTTGLAAASCYIQSFMFSKTFYWLNNLINLWGCFLLYGLCGLLGFVYLYFKIPETEGRTLAEIEEYFTVPTKRHKTVVV